MNRWEWHTGCDSPTLEMGVGQGDELLVLNSQWMNTGQATGAENRGGVTSKSPKGATITQQRSGEAQRLRVGVGCKGATFTNSQISMSSLTTITPHNSYYL
jgi:hypothetical protein